MQLNVLLPLLLLLLLLELLGCELCELCELCESRPCGRSAITTAMQSPCVRGWICGWICGCGCCGSWTCP